MFTNFFKWLQSFLPNSKISISELIGSDNLSIIQGGNHKEIMKLLTSGKSDDFSDEDKQAVMERNNSEEILAMLKNKEIDENLKKIIITRGDSKELLLLCKYASSSLTEDQALKIISYGYYDATLELICLYNTFNSFNDRIIKAIINTCNADIISALLVRKIQLQEEDKLEIIKLNDNKLLDLLFTYYEICSDNLFEAILESRNQQTLHKMLNGDAKLKMSKRIESKLINLYIADEKLLDDFIAFYVNDYSDDKLKMKIVNYFGHSGAVKLLKNKIHLPDNAYITIVENGDKAEIEAMIKFDPYLPKTVIDAILSRGVYSEITTLAQYQSLSYETLLDWCKKYRFEYVETYINFHKTNERLTQLLLLEVLKNTVK